jgi:hypothetical protein
LDATQHCHVTIPQFMTKLQSGHDCCVSRDARMDRQTSALAATHRLDVVDICAKLFQNPSMYDKITVLTQKK